MDRRNRIRTTFALGVLTALAATLTPTASSDTQSATSAAATNVNIYVQEMKLTDLNGSFRVTYRGVVRSSKDWMVELGAVNPNNVGPLNLPMIYSGGPTTSHEFRGTIVGRLTDRMQQGTFTLRARLYVRSMSGGFVLVHTDRENARIFDVPSVFTINARPGKLVKDDPAWRMPLHVTFKVDTNKADFPPRQLVVKVETGNHQNCAGGFEQPPAGTTYFSKNLRGEGVFNTARVCRFTWWVYIGTGALRTAVERTAVVNLN
jgi:hypothetical protein